MEWNVLKVVGTRSPSFTTPSRNLRVLFYLMVATQTRQSTTDITQYMHSQLFDNVWNSPDNYLEPFNMSLKSIRITLYITIWTAFANNSILKYHLIHATITLRTEIAHYVVDLEGVLHFSLFRLGNNVIDFRNH